MFLYGSKSILSAQLQAFLEPEDFLGNNESPIADRVYDSMHQTQMGSEKPLWEV